MRNGLMLRLLRKVINRFKGIPVLIVVYKPWRKGKNVDYNSILPFDNDPYLSERFTQIAEHIRENWGDKLNDGGKR